MNAATARDLCNDWIAKRLATEMVSLTSFGQFQLTHVTQFYRARLRAALLVNEELPYT